MPDGFLVIVGVTLAGAVAAMTLRNPVHCALCLVVAFVGLAMAYFQLGAEFVAFAQVLVYIGAVAILIVFAVLLTRGAEIQSGPVFSGSWMAGIVAALIVFAALATAIRSSSALDRRERPRPGTTVKQLGLQMFDGGEQGNYVLPLEAAGLLLTAALVGAAVIALQERGRETKPSA